MTVYNIKAAARKLELSEFYIRKCVKEGKLKAKMVNIPGTDAQRWIIEDVDLMSWANRDKGSFGQRADGRNKFVLYARLEEVSMLQKLCRENGLADVANLIRRSNPGKGVVDPE